MFKKVMCYIAIVILLVIIILPPVLRIFVKEQPMVSKDVVKVLLCNKADEKINMPFLNNKLARIKYSFITESTDQDNGDVIDNGHNNLLENRLNDDLALGKMLLTFPETVVTNEANWQVYSIDLRDESVYNKVPVNLRGTLDEMKGYYTNLGFTCNVME